MNTEPANTWSEHWKHFLRNHPMLYFLLLLGLAFLTAPLMIAASHLTTVLYKDF